MLSSAERAIPDSDKVRYSSRNSLGKRALVLAQFRTDIFETGERFNRAQTIVFRDCLLQIGRDERFDNDAAIGVAFIEHSAFEKASWPDNKP